MIDVRELTHDWPDGSRGIRGLTFQVGSGEAVGLIGANGAGKTTLFLCLSGILKARPDHIRIAGLDPAIPADRKLLPTRVGIVFQNSDDQLFSSTVLDDVAFGPLNLELPADEVRRRCEEALAQVGLTGSEQRVPFHLSGGEKRRAAIAGILAMRPEVLLLDEPTMFLDPRGRREVVQLIRQLRCTRIIASHDLPMIQATCQRVLLLHEGRLAADGAPGEILADEAFLEAHGLSARLWD